MNPFDSAVHPISPYFYAGRKFRAYQPLTVLKTGPAISMRFVSPVDFLLDLQEITLTQGALDYQVYSGAITPSGTWTPITPIGVNRMSTIPQPPYTSQVEIAYGGSFTGGTERDRIQIRTSASNSVTNNVLGSVTQRGLPAGPYYMTLSPLAGGVTVNDDAQLIIAFEWTELPTLTI